eukprot:CAMPEP_0201911390 /NCGR_PEP_ID=MMETSP0903-20130614/2341_1 /ASSEMBLY_ACC=CAM_ASM_000552 /TAXON_ID=420261 /ORGANISM="Thalassiosira antarctica, Strain CCMP982" /LENGTH=283 /DNA_ID=CAMNT_0048446093 /DNA_START=142 /DNA_END=994 /DNA_ORIENTATION=-
MLTETRILVLKSDDSASNQGPQTSSSLPERTTAARASSIDDDDSDEELGDLIWKSSRTAKALADANLAAALTATANQNQSPNSNSPSHASVPDRIGVISKGADLGQKHGALYLLYNNTRQNSAVPTKRTIPIKEGDGPGPFENLASQKQTSISSCHSSVPNGSGVISKGADLGQKQGALYLLYNYARLHSAVPTKRAIPIKEGDRPAPPKGPVSHLVATMGAPTNREVEVYVVDTERSHLAAKKGAPTMPKQEVFVGDMEQSTLPKYAVMMDAPTIPSKEVFV